MQVHGVVHPWVPGLPFSLLEFPGVPVSPFLHPDDVPWDGSITISCIHQFLPLFKPIKKIVKILGIINLCLLSLSETEFKSETKWQV